MSETLYEVAYVGADGERHSVRVLAESEGHARRIVASRMKIEWAAVLSATVIRRWLS